MKPNVKVTWPDMVPQPALIAKPQRQKQGVIKLLAAPAQPDEFTIRKLNDLAAKQPFCIQHRVKKHDML